MGATIVSFVWYFQPTSRMGGGGGSEAPAGDFGSIFGQPVTQLQLAEALREGRLSYRLRFNEWPSDDQKAELNRLANQRLFLDAELKLHKITVTDEAAARYTKLMMGVRPDDPMPMDHFKQFVQNDLEARGQLSMADFDRFVRHQAGQEYLISLYGMSGKLITASEAEFFYRRENEPMVVETVSFPASEFYSQTEPSEEEIKEYFTKHEADYRLPDRVQVNYVQFNGRNYLTNVDKTLGTNIDDRIDELYHEQGPDAFKDAAGKTLSQTEAEAKIKDELRTRTSLGLATKDAEAFVTDLAQGHDDDHPYTTNDLFTLARAKGLTVKTTPPFDENNGTPVLDVPPTRLQVLFQLRSDDPDDKERSMIYAPSPLLGTNAVYVLGLERRLPSQLRTLAEVRDQVIRDYRRDKSAELAKAAGERFAAAVQVGIAQGRSFDTICAGEFVKPVTLPPFSLSSTNNTVITNKSEFETLQSTCFNTPVGQSTKLIPTETGGMVAYVRNRMPVDEATMRRQLPDFLERLRQQRQIAAFEDWFGREMQQHFVPPPGEQSNPVG